MNRTLLFLASASLAIAPAWADSLADTFARMDRAARTFKGMSSGMDETSYTALAKDTEVQSGAIKLKREKSGDIRTLIEFTKPQPQSVAFDGKTARVYYPKIKTVNVYDVASKRDVLEQVLVLGFGATSAAVRADYDVTWIGPETIDGKPTGHLKLIPKSAEMKQRFQQAELWISDALGVPLQQKFVTSKTGDYTQFTYTGLQLTPSLGDKDLQLKIPKDVQIKQVGR
ncbi:MAG: outer membrane lipoprotein carrier protein LolA [Acidobacteriota bacterium]|nr:outer membrane lipoprotein carrier protein LolA [Acidobacteriota bacterium]